MAVAMADAVALRAAEHSADMVDRLQLTGVDGDYAGLLSPGRNGKRKRRVLRTSRALRKQPSAAVLARA